MQNAPHSTYSAEFYESIATGSNKSAHEIASLLAQHLKLKSILDVGCGQGFWLKEFSKTFGAEVTGVDGKHVDETSLAIPSNRFIAHDLNESLDLAKKFDLVLSLEVAEHIKPESSQCFIESLVRHGNMVLFSAAPPGQGGYDHINEQDPDFWRALFQKAGFEAFDFIRPPLLGNKQVEPWYRLNVMFYAHSSIIQSLPAEITAARVMPGEKIKDFSTPLYRLRKWLIYRTDPKLIRVLSKAKFRLTPKKYR